MIRTAAIAFALATAGATTAQANEFAPAMEQFLQTEVAAWADDSVLIAAILEQNARYSGLSQDDIDAMDLAWRAEVGTGSTPTITPVLTNAAADFLRERVEASGGAITEVFVMDNHGLNVAASDVTSDMWQGDEAKFTETYAKGSGAVHLGDVDFDESTQSFQGQVSMTLVDPNTGDPIGAITVGVVADALL